MDAELARLLDLCSACGKCREVCPVFDCTRVETDVARGRLHVIRAFSDRESPDYAKALSSCLLCGACETHCDAGVHVTDIVRRARSVHGVGALKKILFRNVLDSPDRLRAFGRSARALAKLLGDHAPGDSGLHFRLGSPHLVGERRFPEPPRRDFLSESARDMPQAEAALFTGCVFAYLVPGVAKTALRVLDNAGIHTAVPREQACCGLMAFGAGDRQAARVLAGRFVDTFGRYPLVIALCASCATMLKIHLPDVLPEGESVSARVFEISDFLIQKGYRPSPFSQQKVAYHAPCHLRFAMPSDAPLRLLESAPGLTVDALPGQCCGFGGSFTLSQPEKSDAMGAKRAADLERAGVDVVATSCSGCYLGLFDSSRRLSRKPRICHPVELLVRD